ncbi:MAG: AAA family ATPase, partial [Clostridiaceae bacterium]|nr:AAA family ATPase [Clostridiaceae bacterium]
MIIERPYYLNLLKQYKDKDLIKVITGVRRCGKSVLLFDIFTRYLVESGISKQNIIQ